MSRAILTQPGAIAPAAAVDGARVGAGEIISFDQGWDEFEKAQALGRIGCWRLDARRGVLSWSDEHCRIFGVPPGEPQSWRSFLDYVHPDDKNYVRRKWAAALDGEGFDIEHRIVVEGATKWVREKACLSFDDNGALRGCFGVTQDITAQKLNEEALRWGARRNELLSKTAARLLQNTDPQKVVEELCEEVMQFLDCQAFFNYLVDEEADCLRLNACAGIPEPQARAIERLDYGVAICGCVAREGRRIVAETISAAPDARTALVASYGIEAYCCHPLMYQGRLIGTLSFGTKKRGAFSAAEIEVMESVSHLVSLAMGRIRMEQSLREADRRKDDFLATLSHELRNPLAPIRNAVAVLKRISGLVAMEENLLSMVERQVEHVIRLVDDLMDVSRIGRGKITLKKQQTDLAVSIRHAVEACRPALQRAGHAISLDLPEAPLHADADPVRITQVFGNLLDNAIKYTPAGGRIAIRAAREGDWVAVVVEDTGVGVPADMAPRVFDLFTQVDKNLNRAQGGLGIGLALVKNLVAMHGGDVTVESDGPGLGSRFTVRLPLCAPGRFAAETETPATLPPLRILLVDDNAAAADSLATLLGAWGARPHVAYDGRSGLKAMQDFKPDVVLLDLGMPSMDGFETARRIRQTEEGAKAMLIALSGWGQDADIKRCEQAGFDHHLVKPANLARLQKLLRTAGAPSRGRA